MERSASYPLVRENLAQLGGYLSPHTLRMVDGGFLIQEGKSQKTVAGHKWPCPFVSTPKGWVATGDGQPQTWHQQVLTKAFSAPPGMDWAGAEGPCPGVLTGSSVPR